MKLTKKISLLALSAGLIVSHVDADSSGVSGSVLLVLGCVFVGGAGVGSTFTYMAMNYKASKEAEQKTAHLQMEVRALTSVHESLKQELMAHSKQVQAVMDDLASTKNSSSHNVPAALVNVKRLKESCQRLSKLFRDDSEGNNH